MNTLVIGGTRFMGVHLVKQLLEDGHNVTIATRGKTYDPFGNTVKRIVFDRTKKSSIEQAFLDKEFDIVFDNIAYCANDVYILAEHFPGKRYVMLSTTAVYTKTLDTRECDFDPLAHDVVLCYRNEFPYAESKRHAERMLAQNYPTLNSVAVRFPFVVGKDDYTNRLYFYIEHICKQIPMYIDNYESPMAFVRSDEAGRFLAYFCKNTFIGKINGASSGTISIKEICDYVTEKTGKKPILSSDGDAAPYNGEPPYSINTELASSIGYTFTPLHEWIYQLIDFYIDEIKKENL